MNVANMMSENGNYIPNQFIIRDDNGRYFQSYNSIIVFIPRDGSKIRIGKDWNYSRTTGKYRNKFLGETKKETQAKIDNGTYILDESL